jgi:alkylation response protein AidB-like acyl-CoA dehydrogenase
VDVSLTDEQRLVQQTADTLAADQAPSSARDLAAVDTGAACSRLADTGLIGARLPEDLGGGSASAVEPMLVVESLARHLAPLPYVGAVLGVELLWAAGADPGLLARLASGEIRLPVAFDPTLQRIARLGERGSLVFDAAGADGAIVLDAQDRPFLVASEGDVVEGADLTRRLVRLPDEPARLSIGSGSGGSPGGPLGPDATRQWEALALTLLAADLLGCMAGTLGAAVEYSKQRVQFETHIGAFQAVQHLCADAHVMVEAARSAIWYAAWRVGRADAAASLLAARTAKAYAIGSALAVAETSIQVHGGIAITFETLPHVWLRRILLSSVVLGDEDVQLEAIGSARLAGSVR